jgi:hypothetical protein
VKKENDDESMLRTDRMSPCVLRFLANFIFTRNKRQARDSRLVPLDESVKFILNAIIVR